jgi:predicted amidohydrolase YtcJ
MLFRDLAASGDLGVRIALFRGAAHWREFEPGGSPAIRPSEGEGARAQVSLGPIKIMLDEATTDVAEIRRIVADARAAGEAVAFHAVSEAEVAIALDALRSAPPLAAKRRSPDRIEHGAVIPDSWIADLRAVGVCVVGQPTLVHERGDVYRQAYPPEQHGWLHRVRSLIAAGILYAIGSDAPVTDPNPFLSLFAARQRLTQSGTVLCPDERLTQMQALAAATLGPARAIGSDRDIGRLRVGAIADITVLDPDTFDADSPDAADRTARLTITEGRIGWQRGD